MDKAQAENASKIESVECIDNVPFKFELQYIAQQHLPIIVVMPV